MRWHLFCADVVQQSSDTSGPKRRGCFEVCSYGRATINVSLMVCYMLYARIVLFEMNIAQTAMFIFPPHPQKISQDTCMEGRLKALNRSSNKMAMKT